MLDRVGKKVKECSQEASFHDCPQEGSWEKTKGGEGGKVIDTDTKSFRHVIVTKILATGETGARGETLSEKQLPPRSAAPLVSSVGLIYVERISKCLRKRTQKSVEVMMMRLWLSINWKIFWRIF